MKINVKPLRNCILASPIQNEEGKISPNLANVAACGPECRSVVQGCTIWVKSVAGS